MYGMGNPNPFKSKRAEVKPARVQTHTELEVVKRFDWSDLNQIAPNHILLDP
jgi:hypothetical protein